jgi:major membrane immunogen (membrane-anchored lipoprotein)
MKNLLILTMLSGLFLYACSSKDGERLTLKLMIDGETIINEKAFGDNNIDELRNKHIELINSVENACAYSKFLQTEVKVEETLTSAPTRNSDSRNSISNQNITKLTEKSNGKFMQINFDNGNLLCENKECELNISEGEIIQKQYALELFEKFKRTYQMKSAAEWRLNYYEEDQDQRGFGEFATKLNASINGYTCFEETTIKE